MMFSQPVDDAAEQSETEAQSLTLTQLKALGVLAAGEAISQAAKAAGVSRSTIYRWLKDDASFVAELNRQRQENFEVIHAELRTMAREAVAVVREILSGKNAPASVRLRAALAVLQSVGGIRAPQVGSTDAEEIQTVWKIQQQQTINDLCGSI